jgi:diacylglycerol kinase (ATP)
MLAHAILGPGAHEKRLQLLQSAGLAITSSSHFIAESRPDLWTIIGGDGTIHRFLPDLIQSRVPVLVVPSGSGNDLARALHIHTIQVALKLAEDFAQGNARVCDIDLGVIVANSGKETPFCCTGGVGLDAIAAQFANRLPRWMRARGGYLLAASRALLAAPSMWLQLRINGREIRQNVCLFSFANTSSFGGGLRIAPDARLDDGELDCVLVDTMSRPKLGRAAIALLKGTHLQLKEVHAMRAEALHIDCNPPTQVYADGEFVCETPVEVRVLRRALRVLRPD